MGEGPASAQATTPTVRQHIQREFPLKGRPEKPRKEQEDENAVGGMRTPLKSLKRMPRTTVGSRIRTCIDDFLNEHPEFQRALLAAVGAEKGTFDFEDKRIVQLRRRVADILGVDDIEAVSNSLCSTPFRHGILGAWTRLAQDPGRFLMGWLANGAPAGVARDIPDNNIFPGKDGEADMTIDELHGQLNPDSNYSSLEEDEDAVALIDEICSQDLGWTKVFDNIEEATNFLEGVQPVISKMGVVTKHVKDAQGNITSTQKRLILDCKESNANRCA